VGTGAYFQFPLLGFLLCIKADWQAVEEWVLSIPFIGIFALHLYNAFKWLFGWIIGLSIPFIGIFALHQAMEN
jgi:hypothetical protein